MKTFLQKSMSNFTSLFSSPNNRSIAISSSIAKQLILGIAITLFAAESAAQTCSAPVNPTAATSWGMARKFQSSTRILCVFW
jgi:hypothetical protein